MTAPKFDNQLTQQICDFVIEIGIPVGRQTLTEQTFMPGISVREGQLIIDEAKLPYPGDILHEAGHLAVKTSEERNAVKIDFGKHAGEEMAAIAWSYAALVKLGLEPQVLFHPDGYKGESEMLIKTFASGTPPFGVPLLHWMELCYDQNAPDSEGKQPYPHMIKWLRD